MMSNLTQSTSGEYIGTSLTANNNYGTAYAYDVRGNMQSLSRNGLYAGAKQQIDGLDYDYYPNSNKIRTITDEGDCPTDIILEEPIYSNEIIQATNSITLKPGTTISGVDVNLSIGTDGVQTTGANSFGSKTASRTYNNTSTTNIRVNDTKQVRMSDTSNPGMTRSVTVPLFGPVESHFIHTKPDLLKRN